MVVSKYATVVTVVGKFDYCTTNLSTAGISKLLVNRMILLCQIACLVGDMIVQYSLKY